VGLAVEARGICAGYGDGDVLRGLDLDLRPGELLGVLGPNGSGKSTLVRALTDVIPLRQGHVAIAGRSLQDYSRRELARTVAVVPQWRDELFHFTVFETVLMGRTPYLGRLQREGVRDRAVVEDCLRAADATHLAGRFVTDLSGGEQQRVQIARALAQDTDILLLDEPTTHLDINHQIDIFELLMRLRDQRGLAVLCVLHDLNLAAEYCDRVVLVREGRAVCTGGPREAIAAPVLREVYGLDLPVVTDEVTGRPRVLVRRRGAHPLRKAVPH